MAELNKSIRLSTTPGGEDKYISVKLEQEFDFLEVLSLKISQEDLYASFCANYGVVVGRAIANGGFGVPNAKVSVFIPITDEDERNELIRDLYPYRNVNDKDKNGIRYNLLLSESTCQLNKPVGTFPTKDTLLNNEIVIEIFDKYYRYTTKTNDAGDYMLFGVPVGNKIIHMDVDLSDIGFLSIRPYDLIAQGAPEGFFESKTQFKSSTNLDILPQIKTSNQSVDIIPFWGDPESCQIGITRLDFDIEGDITPNCVFMGSIFTDSDENALQKDCDVRHDMGDQSQLVTGPGQVDILKLNVNTLGTVASDIERMEPESIDQDGVFLFTIPMYYDRVVTNEFGDIVRSIDQTKGVPTKGKYRFKIKFSEQSSVDGSDSINTASLIVPSTDDLLRFSDNIGDYEGDIITHFHTFEWKQVYTTSQYVRKAMRINNQDNPLLNTFPDGISRWEFIGLKNCGEYVMSPIDDSDNDNGEQNDSANGRLNIPYTALIKRFGSETSETKKFRLCFYDAWLNGGNYLFKFESKPDGNDLKCCGLNHGGLDYKTFINENGNGSFYINRAWRRECTVLTPRSNQIQGEVIDPFSFQDYSFYAILPPQQPSPFVGSIEPTIFSFFKINLKNTGANDTNEFVYCKWMLETKIINIGSMLMCEEILDSFEENLSTDPDDPLVKFKKGPTINQPCLGTNIESGIRTDVIVEDLPPTTYRDVNLLAYHRNFNSNWGESLTLFGTDDWDDNLHKWFELKGGDGGSFIKYYCRLDFNGLNGEEQTSFNPQVTNIYGNQGLNMNVLNPSLNIIVGCSNGNASYFNAINKRDRPYYYFGLIPGKTAIEKLKKDFFTF